MKIRTKPKEKDSPHKNLRLVIINAEVYEKRDGELVRKCTVRAPLPREFFDKRSTLVKNEENLLKQYNVTTSLLQDIQNQALGSEGIKIEDVLKKKNDLTIEINKIRKELNDWDKENEAYQNSMIEIRHISKDWFYVKEWNVVFAVKGAIRGKTVDFSYIEYNEMTGDETIHCENIKVFTMPSFQYRHEVKDERFLKREMLEKIMKKADD
jgi:hypothetical protein